MGAGIDIRQRLWSKWVWIVLIWLSIGMFDASDTVFSMRAEGHHHAWLSLFVTLVLSWLPWALASPFILELARRYPPTLRSLWVHVGACAATGVVYAAWTAALEELLNPWLETAFPNGVKSNCMTCHQRASNNGTDFLPVTRGAGDPKDPAFAAGSVRTDFLWSLPFNAK